MTDGARGPAQASAAWAASGMMFLTGRPDGPALGAPAALVDLGYTVGADIGRRTARLGRPVTVDPLAVMAERAAIAGHRRGGRVSCGGSSRLMPCADGWVAATLARPADWDLLAALLGCSSPIPAGEWTTLQMGVASVGGAELARPGPSWSAFPCPYWANGARLRSALLCGPPPSTGSTGRASGRRRR